MTKVLIVIASLFLNVFAFGQNPPSLAFGDFPINGLVSNQPDKFLVSLKKLDKLRVQGLRQSGSYDVCVKASGNLTGSNPQSACDTRGDATLNYTAPADGDYVIEVYIRGTLPTVPTSQTLEYELLVGCDGQCPPPSAAPSAQVLPKFSLPFAQAQTGSVSPGSAHRLYSFNAAPPNSYSISISETPQTGDAICFKVFNPTGYPANVGDCTGTAINVPTVKTSFVPDRSGPFNLLIYALNATSMTYSVSLTCTGATCLTPMPSASIHTKPSSLSFSAPVGGVEKQVDIVEVTTPLSQQRYLTVVPNAVSWLTVDPAVGVLPAVLRVTVDPSRVPASTQTNLTLVVGNSSINIPVQLTLSGTTQFQFQVDSPSLVFQTTNTGIYNQKNIVVRNVSSQAGTVAIRTRQATPWLTLTPAQVSLAPGGVGQFSATLLPQSLPASGPNSLNSAQLVFSSGAVEKEVNVVASITGETVPVPVIVPQRLTLFTQFGKSSADQGEFFIGNGGSNPVDWHLTPSDTALGVAPVQRLSLRPGLQLETVQVGLTDNVRRFDAPGKQSTTVSLRFGNPGGEFLLDLPVDIQILVGNLPMRVSPAGLIATYSGAGPASFNTALTVRNATIGARKVTVSSNAVWLKVPTGDINVPGATSGSDFNTPASVTIPLDVNTSQLPSSGERGLITVSEGALARTVEVLFLNAGGSTGTAPAAPCVSSSLNGVMTSLGQGFQATAGVTETIEARFVDNCGAPLTTGAVTVSLSNGESTLSLTPIGDGRWSTSWTPVIPANRLTLTVQAASGTTAGRFSTFGGIAVAVAPGPALLDGRMFNAAALSANGNSIAPGTWFSLFGTGLASQLTVSDGLNTSVGGTRLLLGSTPVPLLFVSPTQINGVIPIDTPPSGTLPLTVETGGVRSNALSMTIVPFQPGIFAQNQQGSGIAAARRVDNSVIGAADPLRAGDALVLFCSGLGAVNPPVPFDRAAPATTFVQTANPVDVTIGGKKAQVFFAGLTPGSIALYQINVIIPDGIVPSSDVPVQVFVGGAASNTVTIPVK